MKKIPLTKGNFALVDNQDFEEISNFKWFVTGPGYAGRMTSRKSDKRTVILMHKEIFGVKDGKVIDHIDGNKLNNQRENLRFCSVSQNNINSKIRSTNTSGFKGVSYFKQTKKWEAYININKKKKHLGFFSSKEMAAIEYNSFAKSVYGEFAKLNIV